MSEHTFKVDHHRMSTNAHLCWDEISKAAYRAQGSFEMVASTELAETRKDLEHLKNRMQKIADDIRTVVDGMRDRGEPHVAFCTSIADSIVKEIE